MSDQFKKRISRGFGQAAASYDLASDIQAEIGEGLLARIAAAQPARQEPLRILEFGCGTGRFTEKLRDRYPRAKILATDLSPEMAQATNDRFANDPRISTDVMDADHPEHVEQADRFDLICSNMAAQWFFDFGNAVTGQAMLLKKDGLIAHSNLASGTFREWRSACRSAGIKAATPDYPAEDHFRALELAGLDTDIFTETVRQDFDRPMDFLSYLKNIGARTSQQRPASAAALKRACQALEEMHDSRISYDVVYCLHHGAEN